jgi:hypothetical protein
MLGRQESGHRQFFYSFDLDKVVPPDHLLRQIDGLHDLSWVHNELAPFYSHTRAIFVSVGEVGGEYCSTRTPTVRRAVRLATAARP